MDHHAIDQGWGQDRISRQILVRAYCVCFSIAAPLPGSTRLATLTVNYLEVGLHRSDRIGMSEKRGKWGLGGLEGGVGCFLDDPDLISGSEQRKTDQKMVKQACEVIFQGCRRIIQV